VHVLLFSSVKQLINIFFVFNLRVCKSSNYDGNNNGDKYHKGRLTNETGNRSTAITPAHTYCNNYIKGAVGHSVRL